MSVFSSRRQQSIRDQEEDLVRQLLESDDVDVVIKRMELDHYRNVAPIIQSLSSFQQGDVAIPRSSAQSTRSPAVVHPMRRLQERSPFSTAPAAAMLRQRAHNDDHSDGHPQSSSNYDVNAIRPHSADTAPRRSNELRPPSLSAQRRPARTRSPDTLDDSLQQQAAAPQGRDASLLRPPPPTPGNAERQQSRWPTQHQQQLRHPDSPRSEEYSHSCSGSGHGGAHSLRLSLVSPKSAAAISFTATLPSTEGPPLYSAAAAVQESPRVTTQLTAPEPIPGGLDDPSHSRIARQLQLLRNYRALAELCSNTTRPSENLFPSTIPTEQLARMQAEQIHAQRADSPINVYNNYYFNPIPANVTPGATGVSDSATIPPHQQQEHPPSTNKTPLVMSEVPDGASNYRRLSPVASEGKAAVSKRFGPLPPAPLQSPQLSSNPDSPLAIRPGSLISPSIPSVTRSPRGKPRRHSHHRLDDHRETPTATTEEAGTSYEEEEEEYQGDFVDEDDEIQFLRQPPRIIEREQHRRPRVVTGNATGGGGDGAAGSLSGCPTQHGFMDSLISSGAPSGNCLLAASHSAVLPGNTADGGRHSSPIAINVLKGEEAHPTNASKLQQRTPGVSGGGSHSAESKGGGSGHPSRRGSFSSQHGPLHDTLSTPPHSQKVIGSASGNGVRQTPGHRNDHFDSEDGEFPYNAQLQTHRPLSDFGAPRRNSAGQSAKSTLRFKEEDHSQTRSYRGHLNNHDSPRPGNKTSHRSKGPYLSGSGSDKIRFRDEGVNGSDDGDYTHSFSSSLTSAQVYGSEPKDTARLSRQRGSGNTPCHVRRNHHPRMMTRGGCGVLTTPQGHREGGRWPGNLPPSAAPRSNSQIVYLPDGRRVVAERTPLRQVTAGLTNSARRCRSSVTGHCRRGSGGMIPAAGTGHHHPATNLYPATSGSWPSAGLPASKSPPRHPATQSVQRVPSPERIDHPRHQQNRQSCRASAGPAAGRSVSQQPRLQAGLLYGSLLPQASPHTALVVADSGNGQVRSGSVNLRSGDLYVNNGAAHVEAVSFPSAPIETTATPHHPATATVADPASRRTSAIASDGREVQSLVWRSGNSDCVMGRNHRIPSQPSATISKPVAAASASIPVASAVVPHQGGQPQHLYSHQTDATPVVASSGNPMARAASATPHPAQQQIPVGNPNYVRMNLNQNRLVNNTDEKRKALSNAQRFGIAPLAA